MKSYWHKQLLEISIGQVKKHIQALAEERLGEVLTARNKESTTAYLYDLVWDIEIQVRVINQKGIHEQIEIEDTCIFVDSEF